MSIPFEKNNSSKLSIDRDGYRRRGMNVWEIAILKSIKSLGGKAELQQIYERLPNFKQLTEKALRIIPKYGKRPLYHHWVRSHIKDLCQKDELVKIRRSCYSLTEKGIKRIDSDKKKRRS